LKPTSSVISGATMVPCRVTQASMAAPRQLMRFMILHSFSASISLAYLPYSASFLMKKVVWPLSP
jgi:hypothetical protein